MPEDRVTFDVREIRPFLREQLAGSPQLEWVDDAALNAEVFGALLELARAADHDAEILEDGHPSRDDHLQVVVGKRFHIKLRSMAWQFALGLVPAIISGVMATTSPADAAGAFTAAVTAAVVNTRRLDDGERSLYGLAQELGAVNRGDLLIEAKRRGITKAKAERFLERMLAAGVLEETGDVVRIVS